MENNLHNARFSGISRLYGQQQFDKLKGAHIAIIGIGGIGSWAAEGIARSGVGEITLIDLDEICINNSNRQIHTDSTTIGQEKVLAMSERLKKINPEVKTRAIVDFFTKKTSKSFFEQKYDFIIDAIDSTHNKCHLVLECLKREIPLIVCGAAGGKKDPTKIRIGNLAKTENDRLLKNLKRTLRREYGLCPSNFSKIAVSYSAEKSYFDLQAKKLKDKSINLDCQNGMGTASHLTAAIGLAASSYVIENL